MIKWSLKQIEEDGTYMFRGVFPKNIAEPIYVKVTQNMISDYLNCQYDDQITQLILQQELQREFKEMMK